MTSLQHYCCVYMFIVTLVVKVKKLSQLKNVRISRSFLTHSLPEGRGRKGGGKGGATHFHHIISTAVTSNLLLTCRIFTWRQSSTPYIIFLHEQINQLIHSCTEREHSQKLRHDRTMKIINTFSKETNMKSVTRAWLLCCHEVYSNHWQSFETGVQRELTMLWELAQNWEYILIVVISLPPKTHKSSQNQHLILYFHGNELLFYCPWNWQPAQ